MKIPQGKKIYFASDFHLGTPNYEKSLERERKIIRWLDIIKEDAAEVYLVGDLFDFWYEYKTVVPKGYIRFLAKIIELVERDIPVYVFIGNHDMWMFDYLEKEAGVKIYRDSIIREYNDKKFFIGHGDGLGPGDKGYKFIKKVFRNKICIWLFARLHPNFGVGIANYFSKKSRDATHGEDKFYGEEKEWLIQYCKEKLKDNHYDYFIFGHRHFPIDFELNEKSKYINLGDWLQYDTYAVFDGEVTLLKTFEKDE